MAQRNIWSPQTVRKKQTSLSRVDRISDVEYPSRQLIWSFFIDFGMTLRVVSEAISKPVVKEQRVYLDRWVQVQPVFICDLSTVLLGY